MLLSRFFCAYFSVDRYDIILVSSTAMGTRKASALSNTYSIVLRTYSHNSWSLRLLPILRRHEQYVGTKFLPFYEYVFSVHYQHTYVRRAVGHQGKMECERSKLHIPTYLCNCMYSYLDVSYTHEQLSRCTYADIDDCCDFAGAYFHRNVSRIMFVLFCIQSQMIKLATHNT